MEQDLAAIIRRYQLCVGGVKDDTQAYHETFTQGDLAAIRAFAAIASQTSDLGHLCTLLFENNLSARDWPLRHWSKDQLFFVPARRGGVEAALAPLAFPRET